MENVNNTIGANMASASSGLPPRISVVPMTDYAAVAWPRGAEGRKLYAGTALFAESGALVGAAVQTWIVLG